jgi:RNA-binding protein
MSTMSAPTDPKKRPLMGASKLRKALRAAGHRLSPIVQIGKEGITAGVLAQLSEALDHHELVKVKVGTESPDDRFAAAERIQAEGNAQVAQVIGRTILVYRQHATRPKFELPARAPIALPDDAPAPRKQSARAARPQPEPRKAAPSRSREEFWQRKMGAPGGSRDTAGGRRIWTERPPRKEVPKGPAGHAKELAGRRSAEGGKGGTGRSRPEGSWPRKAAPGRSRPEGVGPRKAGAGRAPPKGRSQRARPAGDSPGKRPPRGR